MEKIDAMPKRAKQRSALYDKALDGSAWRIDRRDLGDISLDSAVTGLRNAAKYRGLKVSVITDRNEGVLFVQASSGTNPAA